jgi:hypothetical protein
MLNEIKELENCRSPAEVKRRLMAWLASRLRDEASDSRDVCLLLAEGIETGRLVFRKRRHKAPGQTPVAADLRDIPWWTERLSKIEDK